jgi:hypothetical protein
MKYHSTKRRHKMPKRGHQSPIAVNLPKPAAPFGADPGEFAPKPPRPEPHRRPDNTEGYDAADLAALIAAIERLGPAYHAWYDSSRDALAVNHNPGRDRSHMDLGITCYFQQRSDGTWGMTSDGRAFAIGDNNRHRIFAVLNPPMSGAPAND